MNKIFLLCLFALTAAPSVAGCPAIRVLASAKIVKCEFKAAPDGVLLSVESDEPKVLKTKIFQPQQFSSSCDKFRKLGEVCLDLSQWCIMSGNPPHGVRYTLSQFTKGKCPVSDVLQPPSRDPSNP